MFLLLNTQKAGFQEKSLLFNISGNRRIINVCSVFSLDDMNSFFALFSVVDVLDKFDRSTRRNRPADIIVSVQNKSKRVDTDNMAALVKQGPARISAVDRTVGLYHVEIVHSSIASRFGDGDDAG